MTEIDAKRRVWCGSKQGYILYEGVCDLDRYLAGKYLETKTTGLTNSPVEVSFARVK